MPRLPPCVARTIAVPPDLAKAAISRSRSAGGDVRHVAQHDQRAGRIVGERARRRPSASSQARTGKSRLCARLTSSPASAAATRSSWWPVTTTTSPARLAARRLGGAPHQRPAVEQRQQLVGAAHAARAAGRQHDRVDARRAHCGARLSRGCGRVGISISSPPTPMPAMSASVTSMPAISRSSTQSKPFSLGLRAQPGAPSTGLPSISADHDQIAGIDRHAGADDLAAGRSDRRRDDVVGIAHRRRAEHHHHVVVARRATSAPRRPPPRRAAVRRSAVTRLPERASRASVTLTVLASTLSLTPGSTVWTRPTLSGRNGLTAKASRPAHSRSDLIDQRRLDGERDDLHRRHHLAGLDRGILGDGGDGDRRIDAR